MKRKNNPNLYTTSKCDLTQNKLFDFDNECKNTQRYDVVRYPKIDQINDLMLSFFWRPEEIDMNQDKVDFETADEYEKFIHRTQLQKLVMLDSLQGRGPILTFGQLTTNPEFEGAITTWEFFETIHSRSYSHNIQAVYPDPSVVFDETFDNKLLMKHTKTITDDYNKLYPMIIKYNNKQEVDLHEFKKQILKSMVSINALEGVRFYSGFAAIWSLNEFRNIFSGTTNILKLIARDENVHMALTQTVLNKLRKDEEEGFTEIWKELETWIYDFYWKISEEEMEWIDHIFQHGSPLGLNPDIAKEYIKYITNTRLKAIGLKIIYPGSYKNPISWINKYLNLGASEGALQETESVDYASGRIIMEDVDFDVIWNKI